MNSVKVLFRPDVLAALTLGAVASPSPAQTLTWTGTNGLTWNNTGNWHPATVPNAAAHTALFAGANQGTIDLGGGTFSPGTLSFTGGAYTLANGTLNNLATLNQDATVTGTNNLGV